MLLGEAGKNPRNALLVAFVLTHREQRRRRFRRLRHNEFRTSTSPSPSTRPAATLVPPMSTPTTTRGSLFMFYEGPSAIAVTLYRFSAKARLRRLCFCRQRRNKTASGYRPAPCPRQIRRSEPVPLFPILSQPQTRAQTRAPQPWWDRSCQKEPRQL